MQSRKQSLVSGSLLIFFGVVTLAETLIGLGPWAWAVLLTAAGLGVFGIYLADRSDWWVLIPAYVLVAVASLVALIAADVLKGASIASYVLALISLAFVVVFVRDRDKWWALIPAYTLLAVGVMVGLIGLGVLRGLLIPAYVLLAISTPFLVVYANDTRKWWSLIPGGIMAFIGFSFLIAESAAQYVGAVALIIVGIWILVRQSTRRE